MYRMPKSERAIERRFKRLWPMLAGLAWLTTMLWLLSQMPTDGALR